MRKISNKIFRVPFKNLGDCLFFALVYVALELLVSITPGSPVLRDMAAHADSTTTASSESLSKQNTAIEATDLERPPALLELPNNADHFDSLFAEDSDDATAPFFPVQSNNWRKAAFP